MKLRITTALLLLFTAGPLHAGQSVVVEAQGYACMGDDKSRKQTESVAVKEAQRKAAESAQTHIRSETHVKDSALELDLIAAYARAQVKVLQELASGWYKEEGLGDCYRMRLKAEVIPDEVFLASLGKKQQETLQGDPSAPLSVRIWTDRSAYRGGDGIRVFLKANKPFYGRVVYRDAAGKMLQLLPNPFRHNNYFNGGVVYELPAGDDRFNLEVSPPFGAESVSVYAATGQVGDIALAAQGGVYEVKGTTKELLAGTRGVKLTPKGTDGGKQSAEFAESTAELTTAR